MGMVESFVFCYVFVAFAASRTLAQDLVPVNQCKSDGADEKEKYNILYGDPQNCPQDNAYILETLPGVGWDNLRNVAMGPVLWLNYSQCRITSDRKFLIPDDMHVEALKESNVHVYSQLIRHFSNYTSTTSRTINVEAHGAIKFFSISGSFSKSYQSAKMKIAGDRSVTSRSELRYRQYGIRSHPDPQLHPVFLDRVLDIAAFLQENLLDTARYLAQMLVRDYGTHYVNYVESGALIVREDQLNSSYVNTMDSDKTTVTASAGASFCDFFGIKGSYSETVTHEQITKYLQSRTDTQTATVGGPPYRANFSIDDWIDGMDNNLVTVDRNGDPLYYVITTGSLPMLPLDTVRETAAIIKEAVVSYYKHNTYRGCTSMEAQNFAYIANLDDGTCKKPYTNHTFGGIYQSCTGGLCSAAASQLNPKTQAYSCPEQFTPVLIYSGTKHECVHRCHHFLWFKTHCYDDCSYTDTSPNAAHYEAYWCAATGPVEQNSGYLFGGVYTDTTNNPLTDGKTCPEFFVPLRFGMDLGMFVCVSDDDELAFRFSLPFAGFFSCSNGNPLALHGNINQFKSNAASNQMTLAAFTFQEGSTAWPKSCPSGYSQHLLAINEGCEINYCVEANALSQMALPIIKRPPFLPEPALRYNSTRLLVSASDHLWMKLGGYTRWKPTNMRASEDSDYTMSEIFTTVADGGDITPSHHRNGKDSGKAATIALSVIGTILVGILVAAVGFYVFRYRRRREYRAKEQRSSERSSLLAASSYPPIGVNDENV